MLQYPPSPIVMKFYPLYQEVFVLRHAFILGILIHSLPCWSVQTMTRLSRLSLALKKTTSINRAVSTITPWTGRKPLKPMIVGGVEKWVWDSNGKIYLDMGAGLAVASLGHSHPAILDALHSADYVHYTAPSYDVPGREELSRRILKKAGLANGGAFWCNTGSEANNILRQASIAYQRSQGRPTRTGFATMQNGFHGAVGDAREMTRDGRTETSRNPLLTSEFIALPSPQQGHESITIEKIREIIAENENKIGAILVPGHGGSGEACRFDWPQMTNFYQELSTICHDYDILIFWDCVMSGGGRTGSDADGKGFFASDHYGEVKNDGRSWAKTLTSGYGPGGLAMVSQQVAKAIDQEGCNFGSTYSGQRATILAATAVLDELEKDDHSILRNTRKMGQLWSEQLAPALLEEFPDLIQESNGTGLLQALIFNPKIDMAKLKEALLKEGLLPFLMRHKLNNELILMITPPLTINEEEMQIIARGISKALYHLSKNN